MPKFAANLTMLYNELGFLERFAAAAAAGFRAVEFLFPYAFPAAEIRARLERNRLALVLHNLPAGNWEAGERGIACHPDRVSEFQDGVGKAIEYAKALGVPLVCGLGQVPATDGQPALLDGDFFPERVVASGAELVVRPRTEERVQLEVTRRMLNAAD